MQEDMDQDEAGAGVEAGGASLGTAELRGGGRAPGNLTTSPGLSGTQRRIQVTVRLGENIGVDFNGKGFVTHIVPGGQLDKIGGIYVGDRAVEAGGTSLGTFDQLKSIIQENTSRGEESVDLTFEQVRAPLTISNIWCL